MGLSGAVDWWEEWQLRILVIGSQFVQWLLFLSAFRRKSTKSSSIRLLIWLAYIGSDAMAIYALAALFNRHKKQGDSDSGLPSPKSVLEVVWAPVLLMHLGGQDCITAYNMEDNELWKRHVLAAISQLTVSIYVFCKSWQGDDKKLLQAAILLFTLGGIRCLEKPLALQRASINSLASASDTSVKQSEEESKINSSPASSDTTVKQSEESKINSPSAFVKQVWHLYQVQLIKEKGKAEAKGLSVKARGVNDDLEANDQPYERAGVEDGGEANRPSDKAPAEDGGQTNIPSHEAKGQVHPAEHQSATDHWSDEAKRQVHSAENQSTTYHWSDEQEEDQVNKLFVDLASPYLHRLGVTQSFLKVDGITAYKRLEKRLSATFDLLYTKKKMSVPSVKGKSFLVFLGQVFRFACIILPFAAIGLFDRSHRETHDPKDVKVTYTLLCCTAVMEFLSYIVKYGSKLSGMVGQYSFIGYFARNTTYNKRMSILGSLKIKEYINKQWSMKPIEGSQRIAILVHEQVKGWWKPEENYRIKNAADYTKFNNYRGQWTLLKNQCSERMEWSINRSFDESVLVWHIATDLCFFDMDLRSEYYDRAGKCREISNYMMYLLFSKPEMLMAGTRRNLLIAAHKQLESLFERGEQPPVDERAVAQRIIAKVESSSGKGFFVHDAWRLAQELLDLNDETKMWQVIEGVWVEMLSYSASRCRGYLHAKSLGTGGELHTFVWLLWSHMGMETLAESLQMPDLPSEEEDFDFDLVGQVVELGSTVIEIGVEDIKKD